MKNIVILIIAVINIMLSPQTSLSQQTSTLKLKFSLTDSDGDIIKSNESNYIYGDSYNGDKMSLDANNDQIRYDNDSNVFILTITVPRYKEYSFSLRNQNSGGIMNFQIFMDGNLSEQLTIDEIRFTPGVFVFNLTTGTNYFNKGNLNYSKGSKEEYNIKDIDWKATHINE